jgi:hypothetical protein
MERERGDETPYIANSPERLYQIQLANERKYAQRKDAEMGYPHPMDVAEAEDREANMLDFVCVRCDKTFHLHGMEYDGRWDHPPGEPVCPECEDE